jgi:thiamine-monophosphate kinase
VDVAILGELFAPPLLRSGASPGDLLATTGELGASAAGLLALQNGASGQERLIRRHLRPEPRVGVGALAAGLGVGAAIDISDGLASDARRICEQSGVGCRVDLGLLPVANDTRTFLESLERDPEVLAASGGEDYELLISAPASALDALAEGVNVPLTVIGEVTDGADVVLLRGDEPVKNLSGYDHFSAKKRH